MSLFLTFQRILKHKEYRRKKNQINNDINTINNNHKENENKQNENKEQNNNSENNNHNDVAENKINTNKTENSNTPKIIVFVKRILRSFFAMLTQK
jgi:hypothetical protein